MKEQGSVPSKSLGAAPARRPAALLLAGLVAFALALASATSLVRPAEAAFLGHNGTIAFERFGDVYLADPDGSAARKITGDGVQANPALSPDGEKIAFNSSRPNGHPTAVYLVGVGGGAVSRLAFSQGYDNDPDWEALPPTPVPEGGDFEIYGIGPNGAQQLPLTHNTAADEEPAVSPNGQKVAFVSDRDGNRNLYVTNPDGTGQTRLTSSAASDSQPAFSPDGSRIAFVSDRDGNQEIYAVAADGTGATRLTNNPAKDTDPD